MEAMNLKRVLCTPEPTDTADSSPARKQLKVTTQHPFDATTSTASQDQQHTVDERNARTFLAANNRRPSHASNTLTHIASQAQYDRPQPPQTVDAATQTVETLPPYTASFGRPACQTCGRDDLLRPDLNRHRKSPYCVDRRTFQLAYARIIQQYSCARIPRILATFDKWNGQETEYHYQESDWGKVESLLAGHETMSWVRWFSTLPKLTKLCRDLDWYFGGRSHYPPAYLHEDPDSNSLPHDRLHEQPNLSPSTYPPPYLPSTADTGFNTDPTAAAVDTSSAPTEAEAATHGTASSSVDSPTVAEPGFRIYQYHSDGRFRCSGCTKSYTRPSDLRKHWRARKCEPRQGQVMCSTG
jgi:transposase-like protein